MATIVFLKTAGGADMTINGDIISVNNAVNSYTVGSNKVSARINNQVYHFYSATDTITVNGAGFSGTPTQLKNKLLDEVFNPPLTGVWGSITGTLASQTDLSNALALKAPLAAPQFTGAMKHTGDEDFDFVRASYTSTQQGFRWWAPSMGALHASIRLNNNSGAFYIGAEAGGYFNVFTQLTQFVSDLENLTADKGLILKSTNGTRYKLTISNAGVLVITGL